MASYRVGSTPFSIAVADFNQDNLEDLVTADSPRAQNGSVRVWLGRGDGTFAYAGTYAAGLQSNFVAVGDFDLDGHPDLAISNWGSDDISVLRDRSPTRTIAIDIKPESLPNSINPYSRGVIPLT